MNKFHEEEIVCPECKKKNKHIIWDYIDISEQVINLDLFQYTCSKCNKNYDLEYATIYKDEKNKFIIYYIPLKDKTKKVEQLKVKKENVYHLRIVHTKEDLIEKIHIFKYELEDTIIEILKPFVISKLPKQEQEEVIQVLFHTIEGDKMKFIMNNTQGNSFQIKLPKQYYEQLTTMYQPQQENKFIMVNKKNVFDYLKKLK